MTLRIYNHYTGKKEEFTPGNPDEVTMYVCGMTVQGKPHMGHMLAFVSADLVRRSLEFLGYRVLHVQNFTDIDDKIIARAEAEGTTAQAVAEANIEAYQDAARRLNILPAHVYPKVTEHMQEIVAAIEGLIAKGHAYAVGGNVYFDVRSWPSYGRLSGRRLDELQVAVREGLEVDAAKHDPFDFALWKRAKPGEPAWDSPWGKGRPGWHIECTAMSTKYLGETFDLHGGGRDLIFPHHENELAQSCALGGDFVRYWIHNGLLNLEGQKMSKSTGHFFAVDEVLSEYEGDVVRFYLLRGQFRNQMEYSRERLDEAKASYERMKRALLSLEEAGADPQLGGAVPRGITSQAGVELEAAAQKARHEFRAALCDDFNAGAAIAACFELIRVSNLYLDVRKATEMDAEPVRATLAVLREALDVLGLFEAVRPQALPAEILELAARRDAARRARDFRTADAMRNELMAAGYLVEDGPEGTRLRRA